MLPCGFVQKIWPFYMAELIFSTISLCVFLIIVSNSKTYMGTIWLFNSSPWKDPPFLSSVNHLFRLGPSIPWRTVSHNQRVTILGYHQGTSVLIMAISHVVFMAISPCRPGRGLQCHWGQVEARIDAAGFSGHHFQKFPAFQQDPIVLYYKNL